MTKRKVPYLTTPQVANMIKMSEGVIRTAVKNGELAPINKPIEGAKKFFMHFAPADVNTWIETRFGKQKRGPLLEVLDKRPPTGPGKLTSMDEKLDTIEKKLDFLIKLWS